MLNKPGQFKNFFLCSEAVIAVTINMVNQCKDLKLSAIREGGTKDGIKAG